MISLFQNTLATNYKLAEDKFAEFQIHFFGGGGQAALDRRTCTRLLSILQATCWRTRPEASAGFSAFGLSLKRPPNGDADGARARHDQRRLGLKRQGRRTSKHLCPLVEEVVGKKIGVPRTQSNSGP